MTESNRYLSMIEQNKAVLASIEAAIPAARESESTARRQVEMANQVLDEVTSTHRVFAENLESLTMSAQRIRGLITRIMVGFLPAELIEQIVLTARDSLLFSGDPTAVPVYPTEFMLGLLAVCRRWRNVLREAPRVWQILPMKPSPQKSVELVKYLRPLVRDAAIHWWLDVRSTMAVFNDAMETFQKVHSDCMFKDGQFKLLTLVVEPGNSSLGLRLRASTVTTLVAGITTRHASAPCPKPKGYLCISFERGALPALETLELRGITLFLGNTDLPHLRTFIARASPVEISNYMIENILKRSPQLSKLKVDDCVYISSKHSYEPQRRDVPTVFPTITVLELDLLGVNGTLETLAKPAYVDFEFRKIKELTLTNHLYRDPSSLWKGTKVEYDSWRVKRILSKMHGVEQLHLRIGRRVIPDLDVPFTLSFQTDNLAPLKEVEELVLQCAARSSDELRVTLEGVQRDPNLFPLLRKIRLERCKTMTLAWEPLLETVRAREGVTKVELVDCGGGPEACPELDDLLVARGAW